MKMNLKLRFALVAAFTVVTAIAAKAPYRIVIADGHPDALYKVGEEAVFTLSVSGTVDRTYSPDATVDVVMDRFDGEQIHKVKWDPAKEPVLTLRGSLDAPGFLRVKATTQKVSRWGLGDGNATWGVAYEPRRIVGSTPFPADFEAYWRGELKRLDETVPADFRMERIEKRSQGSHDMWKVSVATFNNARIWGFFITPKTLPKSRLPLEMRVRGAGQAYSADELEREKKPDELRLMMNVHRYEPQDTKAEQKPLYDRLNAEFEKKYGPGLNYSRGGWGVSREACYFHDAIVGLVRLTNIVCARPEVDPERIWYTSSSQGTGIGVAVTAFTPAIRKAFFRVPALCDICGSSKGHQSGWPETIESQRDQASKEKAAWVAQYFDAVNFARLVKIPVRVAVGFSDNCCPPWGGYSFFNALKSADKDIYNGIGMWHSTYPQFEKAGEAWLRQ